MRRFRSRQPAYGPWSSCTFYYQAPAVPAVGTLNLQTVDSTTSGIPAASDPTLIGTLSGSGDLGGVTVVFTNGSNANALLGYAQTDSDGNFSFTPCGLTAGSAVTINAAASAWTTTSAATPPARPARYVQPLAQTQPAATITELDLVDPTNTSGTPTATDPTVAGEVACDTGAEPCTDRPVRLP